MNILLCLNITLHSSIIKYIPSYEFDVFVLNNISHIHAQYIFHIVRHNGSVYSLWGLVGYIIKKLIKPNEQLSVETLFLFLIYVNECSMCI